ncbi:hypothetical protein HY837_01050 [archaeon]|nr:hypothetical protein [archaeon]
MSEEFVFDGEQLDKLIEKADGTGVPVENGADYYLQQFYYLLHKVFSDNVVYGTEQEGSVFYAIKEDKKNKLKFCFFASNSGSTGTKLFSVNDQRNFSVLTKGHERYGWEIEKDVELKVECEGNPDRYSWLFVTPQGDYSPIMITTYTKEGFDKAKIFGQVYNQLSGAKVTIVRENFDDEKQIDDLVEKAQTNPVQPKKKRHNPEFTPEELAQMPKAEGLK